MKDDNLEKLGLLIDKLDNFTVAMSMPLPDRIHIESIKTLLPEMREEVLDVYTDEGGENVWD